MSDKAHRQRTPFYHSLRIIAGPIVRLICPMRFHNRERVDAFNAPYMVIGNHKSFMDPVAVGLGVRYDEIHFVGKKELSKYKLAEKLLLKLHGIMIGRGETDMAAMRKCMQTLKDGHVLGIFPEGTRHQKDLMEHVESGTAVIALRSKVPVLPVYIHGKIRPFHMTHVYFGDPIPMDDLLVQGINTESIQTLCTRIHDTFHAMRNVANTKK